MRTVNPNYGRASDITLGRAAAGKAASAGIHVSDNLSSEVILAVRQDFVGADVQNMDNGRVRIVIKGNGASFTNNTGGGTTPINYGDVVVIQTDGTITTTTTAQDTRPAGVVQTPSSGGAPTPIIFSGYIAQINTTGTVNSGDYLETSTSAGKAEGNATQRIGSFARALAAGPNPPALLFGQTYLSSSSAANAELNIEGGQDVIKAHGTLGSTATFDPTDGNVHTGTLNANCTFTINPPVGTGGATLSFFILQDGTGGWAITWPGSVAWVNGVTPTPDTTAGSLTVYELASTDGGTSWLGSAGTGVASGFATPAIVLGSAAAAGSATTVIRSDATIAAFDATVPTTSAVGDSAATGSAAKAARRDHAHGREAFGSPVAVGATNSDGTATTVPRSDHVHASAGGHTHVANETHLSDGSTTTYTLDNYYEPESVIAWNTTTIARLIVTEVPPDQATVSAAGASGDKIVFDYAASLA